ncbi:MAG: trigger factor [Chitinophagaceae bacterium]
MATVTRENIGLLNDKITVQLSKEDYLPAFEKSLKQYSKVANIPGFRKGMVPAGMIRKMHGPAIFTEEIIRSVEKELNQYMTTERPEIFGQPIPTESDAAKINMNEPADYAFHFEIGLKPSFEISALKKAKPTFYKVKVTDEMVMQEVERLQNRFGKMTEPETVESDEHVLNVSFEACDKAGVVAEGASKKDNSLLVKYFTEKTRKSLIGKKKGDTLVVQLNKAFEEKEKEWVIKDLGTSEEEAANTYYLITITKVGFVEKRVLDEAFFKEVYPTKNIASEDEFKNEIRSEIEKYWNQQSNNQLHHQLYHLMLEETKMDLPESFLKKWLHFNSENSKTTEEIEKEYPTFNSQLRWTLITDKIVKEQQLEVSREELKDSFKQQVMGYFGGMSLDGQDEWLDEYVEKLMKDEQQAEGTYRRLVTEKIFEWAAQQVKKEEKEIDAEAFVKMNEAHQHQHH